MSGCMRQLNKERKFPITQVSTRIHHLIKHCGICMLQFPTESFSKSNKRESQFFIQCTAAHIPQSFSLLKDWQQESHISIRNVANDSINSMRALIASLPFRTIPPSVLRASLLVSSGLANTTTRPQVSGLLATPVSHPNQSRKKIRVTIIK